jgi:hypothetical protein
MNEINYFVQIFDSLSNYSKYIHTFQIFKSFQDSSQIHSSRTILIAAFQRHFILKGSTEVRQLPTLKTNYSRNE